MHYLEKIAIFSRARIAEEVLMLPINELPKFIQRILPRFSTIFNKAQLRHFGEYLTGLIVSDNKTVTCINAQFLDHTDQSSKNHFFNSSCLG